MSNELASLPEVDQPIEHLEIVAQTELAQESNNGRLRSLANKALGH